MKLVTFAPILMSACLATTTLAAGNSHWGCSGHEGPEHWGELDSQYALCGSGKNQSPINLTGLIEADLLPIDFSYVAGGYEMLNNGHTIQVNYKAGSNITLNGHTYELKQFHFHSPSENTINGKSFPMEAHLVHADNDGNLAVIALMFEEGQPNNILQTAWEQIPVHEGDNNILTKNVNVDMLLPVNRDYYRFNGSLTTPPCTEGVTWLVMRETVGISKQQIEQFSRVMHHPNNRPVQAINSRTILK